MKTILEWKKPEELPEKNGKVLVYCEDKVLNNRHIYQIHCLAGIKVSFCYDKVIVWCYIDTTILDTEVCNINFNKEWIEKLHDNAVKH